MSTAAGQASAAYPIYNLIYRGQLGGTTAKPTGGNYPHDSTQYDLFLGKTSGTSIQFTKDLAGNTLTYNDSYPYNTKGACVECHMDHDVVQGTFGHSFKATEESFKKVLPTEDLLTVEHETEALMADLHTMLDVDKDGTVKWTRSSVDADLVAFCKIAGMTNAAKVIALGVAWNYNMVHGDSSEGAHNPKYIKSLLTHCKTIMTQLKAAATSSDSARITWY